MEKGLLLFGLSVFSGFSRLDFFSVVGPGLAFLGLVSATREEVMNERIPGFENAYFAMAKTGLVR